MESNLEIHLAYILTRFMTEAQRQFNDKRKISPINSAGTPRYRYGGREKNLEPYLTPHTQIS